MRHQVYFLIVLTGTCFAQSPTDVPWTTAAHWHRSLKKTLAGTLTIDTNGVEFRSPKFTGRWPNVEIQTFDLSSHELTLTTYKQRRRHEPGVQRFSFTVDRPVPTEIAAQLTERVGKPVRNGVPLPSVAALSEIPAHYRMWSGGSNGTLRLKDSGIDYVTENDRDSRTWRWADIQTIANPNPYELRIIYTNSCLCILGAVGFASGEESGRSPRRR